MPPHLGLPLLAARQPLPPGQTVAVEILGGAAVAIVFAALIWDAFQPGGSYTWGRYRRIEITRFAPLSFWFTTALYAAICAAGVTSLCVGLARVFLWPLR